MAWADGQLYIGDTDALLRVPFTPGQTRIDAKPVVIARYPGGGNHWARNLLLAKDVLQHWSHSTIHRFLAVLPRFRFALLTNGVAVGETPNEDIPDSGFRLLDLTRAPFNLRCERVYSYRREKRRWRGLWWEPHRFRKDVLLVRGAARP